jgi:hypothetical protein
MNIQMNPPRFCNRTQRQTRHHFLLRLHTASVCVAVILSLYAIPVAQAQTATTSSAPLLAADGTALVSEPGKPVVRITASDGRRVAYLAHPARDATVALRPGDRSVQVALTFVSGGSGITVNCLDGGQVVFSTQPVRNVTGTVSAAGTFVFAFKPATNSGLHRVVISSSDGTLTLAFRVPDAQGGGIRPGDTPFQ